MDNNSLRFGDEVEITKENFMDVLNHMNSGKSFQNASCMLMEYHDVLKSPWYVLLSVISQNEKVRPILNLNEIEYLDTDSLFEWYCNRKNRNFLLDLANQPLDKCDYDKILEILMTNNKVLYDVDIRLNAANVLEKTLASKLVDRVVIYNETDDLCIRDDIAKMYKSPKVEFRHGDFGELLSDIPIDTTYFFSDFNKVMDLANHDHLNYASIILPNDFEYNFIRQEDGTKKPEIDFDYLAKEYLFKLNYYNSCYN